MKSILRIVLLLNIRSIKNILRSTKSEPKCNFHQSRTRAPLDMKMRWPFTFLDGTYFYKLKNMPADCEKLLIR